MAVVVIIVMLIVGDFGGVPKGSRSSNPPAGYSGVGILVVDNGSSGRAQKTGWQRDLHPKQLTGKASKSTVNRREDALALLGLIRRNVFPAPTAKP